MSIHYSYQRETVLYGEWAIQVWKYVLRRLPTVVFSNAGPSF